MAQEMGQPLPLIRERMKTPRAAAIAGILFSALLAATLVLLPLSLLDPRFRGGDGLESGTCLR